METVDDSEHFSKLNCASYGSGAFVQQFYRMAFTSLCFHFYEAVLGLDPWLTSIGFVIFALWNAVNDPLIGYLVSRPFKFTRRWGRFFPWIVIGGIPWILSYLLLYIPPAGGDAMALFIWLIFTTCIFDTFNSLFFVNFQALFPNKYRSNKRRRSASGIVTFLGQLGIAMGSLVPPLLVRYENAQTYLFQSVVITLIGAVFFILGIRGWREDQSSIDDYLRSYEIKEQKTVYLNILKSALKIKPFLAFLVLYATFQTVTYCVQTSVVYVVDFVLDAQPIIQTLLQAAFLIGGIVSIPFWIKYSHKVNNNKKTIILGCSILSIFSVTLTFFPNLVFLFILIVLWGVGLGAVWIMLKPIMADIIDQAVVNTKLRGEGVFYGIYQFFGRTGLVTQALIFGFIHSLTGFAVDPYSPSSLWGIRFHFGLVPVVFLIVGILVFWRYYTLTPDKVRENQEVLKGVGL